MAAFDEYVHSYADPRVLVYPFMASMWPNVAFCFSYLFLILYGQRFMTPRPPLQIPQFVMVFYNGFVVYCLCLKAHLRYGSLSKYSKQSLE